MNIPYVFKKCNKCGRWLVASTFNFSKHRQCKDGLRGTCKECVSAYGKKYRGENKEKEKKRHEKYNEEHKGERRKYCNKYREENKKYFAEYQKIYSEENKEKITEYRKNYNKKYYGENKEKILKRCKHYYQTPQGQVVAFNACNKRRKREEQQGNGITKDQWLEMMNFFNWECAYSGISVSVKKNRSIDHIVPLVKGGAHEIWNCVPMDRSLNSSKNDKDIKEWYPQQDFYNKDRLNKIYEWRKYAYNKWGKEVNTKAI